MSVPIPFNPFEQRLNDQNVIKPKAIKNGSGELKPESLSKNENTLDEVQGSTAGEIKSSLIHSLNRKVDYHIEEDGNEVVIKIRDEETAGIAVKFSLTGHLVFSTVHANDAVNAITRLLDIGIAPFLLGSCANLIVAQRLIRTICKNCKEEYKPSQTELAMIKLTKEKANSIAC